MRRSLSALCLFVALTALTFGCGDSDRADTATNSSVDTDHTADTTAPPSTEVASPTIVGVERLCTDAVAGSSGPITDPELVEISGVAASRNQPDVLWVHNDSGSPNAIWAIDPDGAVLGRFTVNGVGAFDWEDIAIDAAHTDDLSYLYIADTGDNFATSRSEDNPARIYRVPELDVATGEPSMGEAATEPAEAFTIAYADGAHDAEALLADPLTGDVFVISKQWDGTAAGLYLLPDDVIRAGAAPAAATTMQRVTDVAATAGTLVTAADISSDGTKVGLRTYGDVLLWDRDPDHSIAETLAAPPTCTRALDEAQGEAVAFDPDGEGLVTISEGEGVLLNWLRVPEG